MATDTETRNMALMQTLDDAWNAQDQEVFVARHKPDVVVYWPGQPEPTRGIDDHLAESIDFWRTFPDQALVNRPIGSSSLPAIGPARSQGSPAR